MYIVCVCIVGSSEHLALHGIIPPQQPTSLVPVSASENKPSPPSIANLAPIRPGPEPTAICEAGGYHVDNHSPQSSIRHRSRAVRREPGLYHWKKGSTCASAACASDSSLHQRLAAWTGVGILPFRRTVTGLGAGASLYLVFSSICVCICCHSLVLPIYLTTGSHE